MLWIAVLLKSEGHFIVLYKEKNTFIYLADATFNKP